MDNRTDRPGSPESVVLFLLSIGLVAAAIVLIIASAFVSSLDADKAMQAASGDIDQVEAKSITFEAFPIDGITMPAEAVAKPPEAEAGSTQPPLTPPGLAPAAESISEVARTPEPVEPLPSGNEPPRTGSDDPAMTTLILSPLSDNERDQTLREVEPQSRPETGRERSYPASPDAAPPPATRYTPSYIRFRNANVAPRQLRLKKECGPIRDSALHRSCVASFNRDYPAR